VLPVVVEVVVHGHKLLVEMVERIQAVVEVVDLTTMLRTKAVKVDLELWL
jgi:hypothetical protein